MNFHGRFFWFNVNHLAYIPQIGQSLHIQQFGLLILFYVINILIKDVTY